MKHRRSLTLAEREAIYDRKMGGVRLADLAQEYQWSLGGVRKWWRIGRKEGRAALRQPRRSSPVGALSRFAPVVAEQEQRRRERGGFHDRLRLLWTA